MVPYMVMKFVSSFFLHIKDCLENRLILGLNFFRAVGQFNIYKFDYGSWWDPFSHAWLSWLGFSLAYMAWRGLSHAWLSWLGT
ncbi:hypothetical protein VNO77_44299 [Canavalia gladiata]|uniref:Uncharacterized protein n=1 Tax=Canavalia gladiata TaxID=3824 RepID=A0AAN9PNN9_CANGL